MNEVKRTRQQKSPLVILLYLAAIIILTPLGLGLLLYTVCAVSGCTWD